ncbi:uncharacterized protein LOC124275270 [Haliotis rubra]|uniref:uncharacterized protein LOC124275270 n=1 Tax=Haliotis rubra TaxID=36100 RepID=UPI001EE5B44A|nr:uncharacterized protein LOC124275270 [Haliotis rubra]
MAVVLPGGLMEIVFSFDTTGSMNACLTEIRGRLQDIIQRLQADIPAIRMAVFAHGDYCTKSSYVTKWIDFSTDVKKLCDFVMNVKGTGGTDDGGECYELVLRQVGENLSWTPGSNRALVLVGDDNPHEPNFRANKRKIDWREEIRTLHTMGIKIYGVECDNWATIFYRTISKETECRHLKIENFTDIFDFLMAICDREHGAEIFHTKTSAGVPEKDETAPVLKTTTSMQGVKQARKNATVAVKEKLKVPRLKKTASSRGVQKSKRRSTRTPRTKSLKVKGK